MRTDPSPATPLLPMALFMGVMTCAWSTNAWQASPILSALGLLAGAGVALAAVLGTGRRGRQDPPAGTPGRAGSRGVPGPVVGLFALIEVVVIAGVTLLLARAGRGELVMPAVALVVAAHFALFRLVQRSRLHLLTTALGVAGAGAALLLATTGALDAAAARALAGLSLAACTLAYGAVFLVADRGSRPRTGLGTR
ncbi:hypothetical protein C1N80_13700 [Brachybacterium sp. SGAir0954]|uniref:hypothetical protein n=1 Tax=Brachybacterium sp. SGAir0954 TaxID=2571029 RepID=UPI0010CCB50B|nr:hypothetical protein [Brachybacterium sp. SGAir0954]QCR54522.1 hypothetical protein C1N80_13700 [Brachybacterium sp. SGAir0954]